MNQILKCDLCGADAGDDPYHATMNGNGHVHICASCFDPQQHDVAVLKAESQKHLTEKTTALFEKLEALELALRLCREGKQESSQQWTKCGEQMPEERVRVLVYANQNVFVADFDMGRWFPNIGNSYYVLDSITHWMPLPLLQPPKDQ